MGTDPAVVLVHPNEEENVRPEIDDQMNMIVPVVVKINSQQGIYDISVNRKAHANEVLYKALHDFHEEFQQDISHHHCKLIHASTFTEIDLNQSIGDQVNDQQVVRIQYSSKKIPKMSPSTTASTMKQFLISSAKNFVFEFGPTTSRKSLHHHRRRQLKTSDNKSLPMLNRNPTALEAVMTLQNCTLQDICTQCGVDQHQADHLKTAVSNVVEYFGGESDGNDIVHSDNGDEQPASFMRFYEDSPGFRHELSEAEVILRSDERRLSDLTDAASDFCVQGDAFCAMAREFARVLQTSWYSAVEVNEEEDGDRESMHCIARDLGALMDNQLKPLRECVGSLADRLSQLVHSFESYLVEPMTAFVQCDMQDETKRLKEKLNRAFFKYHKQLLECATFGRANPPDRYNAVVRDFQVARVDVVKNFNALAGKKATYVAMCAKKCLRAVQQFNAPMRVGRLPELNTTTIFSRLQAACQSLDKIRECIERCDDLSSFETLIPPLDVSTKPPGVVCQGYAFRLVRSEAGGDTYDRTRKWLFIDRGFLCTLRADRKTPEVLLDLGCSRLVEGAHSSLRYALSIESETAREIFQMDSEASYGKWLHYLSIAIAEGRHEPLRESRSDDDDEGKTKVQLHPLHKCPAQAFKQVTQCSLPVSTVRYFELFVSNESQFLNSLYSKRKCREVYVPAWTRATADSGVRRQSFRIPVTSSLVSGTTRVEAVEQYHFSKDRRKLVLLSQNVSLDVPYGSYFSVETRLEIVQSHTHPDHCELRASVGINFTKATMLRSIIESSCVEETSETMSLMIALILEELRQKQSDKTRSVNNIVPMADDTEAQ